MKKGAHLNFAMGDILQRYATETYTMAWKEKLEWKCSFQN